jgi:hypothetical protein
MDFLPMAIDGRKYEKKNYQSLFVIVLLTFKSDIYESRLMYSRMQVIV